MITHKVNIKDDSIQASVHWNYGGKEKKVEQTSFSFDHIGTFVCNVKRKAMIEVLEKYGNHRNYLLCHGLALINTSKTYSLSRVRSLITTVKNQTLIGVCRSIVAAETDLLMIMPSIKSRYYKSNYTLLTELLNDAKNLVQEYEGNRQTFVI